MSDSRRVLQAGYGRIGRAIFDEYDLWLDTLMAVDPAVDVGDRAWDGKPVDMTVIVVDTPALEVGRYDYASLLAALDTYLPYSDFVLVRSTVGLDFLDEPLYVAHADRIGFAPEFYGTTEHSARTVIDLGFSVFSDSVPDWFVNAVRFDTVVRGTAAEVIVAKLAENAYLATKVTFFHELYEACAEHDLDFESVRQIVTSDPRIVIYHSAVDGPTGWSSHCFDKDVPVYVSFAGDGLVAAMLDVNRRMISRR